MRDINNLPYLTKEIIQKELSNLYTNKFDKVSSYYTGGSSSVPMKLYAPRSVSRSKEKVYANYTFEKLGYKYREKAISMSARGKADEGKGLYWEYQEVDNYLLVSVNHLDIKYIKSIVNEIIQYSPEIFYGYPSAIVSFIKACKSIGIFKLKEIKGILLTSESVSHEQVTYIQDFFCAPVISHYGHTERVVAGYRYNKDVYNFYNSYGLTRVIDDEIIGTSFDNIVMPYINYKTKDYISGIAETYHNTDIMKSSTNIQGRIQEFVVTKENISMPILSIGAGHYDSYEHVDRMQFYQDEPGKIILHIQSGNPEKVQSRTIIAQMEEQVNNKIDFEIEFKDEIEKTSRRKNILCIQKLEIEKYRRHTI